MKILMVRRRCLANLKQEICGPIKRQELHINVLERLGATSGTLSFFKDNTGIKHIMLATNNNTIATCINNLV